MAATRRYTRIWMAASENRSAVAEAARRAELRFERVTEAVTGSVPRKGAHE